MQWSRWQESVFILRELKIITRYRFSDNYGTKYLVSQLLGVGKEADQYV